MDKAIDRPAIDVAPRQARSAAAIAAIVIAGAMIAMTAIWTAVG
jgi:hypothetical protein